MIPFGNVRVTIRHKRRWRVGAGCGSRRDSSGRFKTVSRNALASGLGVSAARLIGSEMPSSLCEPVELGLADGDSNPKRNEECGGCRFGLAYASGHDVRAPRESYGVTDHRSLDQSQSPTADHTRSEGRLSTQVLLPEYVAAD